MAFWIYQLNQLLLVHRMLIDDLISLRYCTILTKEHLWTEFNKNYMHFHFISDIKKTYFIRRNGYVLVKVYHVHLLNSNSTQFGYYIKRELHLCIRNKTYDKHFVVEYVFIVLRNFKCSNFYRIPDHRGDRLRGWDRRICETEVSVRQGKRRIYWRMQKLQAFGKMW